MNACFHELSSNNIKACLEMKNAYSEQQFSWGGMELGRGTQVASTVSQIFIIFNLKKIVITNMY